MMRLRHSAAVIAATAIGIGTGIVALSASSLGGSHGGGSTAPFSTIGTSSHSSTGSVESETSATPSPIHLQFTTTQSNDTPEATETPEATDTPTPENDGAQGDDAQGDEPMQTPAAENGDD